MEQLRDAPWIRRAWQEGYVAGQEGEEDGSADELCPMPPRWLYARGGAKATNKEESAMGRHFVSYEAQCPFYKAEDKNIIYCEGVEETSSIHNAFPGSAAKYKQRYCCDDWQSCMIAAMLWSKYD